VKTAATILSKLTSVDATEARQVTEFPMLLKASIAPLACPTISTM
jgi:hypothetical protein